MFNPKVAQCKKCGHRIQMNHGYWFHVCHRKRHKYLGVVCKVITDDVSRFVEYCDCDDASPE
jgi:hypothetical protein